MLTWLFLAADVALFLANNMTISFLFADMDNDVTNSPLEPILLMGWYQKQATNLAQTFSSPLNSTKIGLFQTIFKITIATQNNIQSLFLKNIQYQSSNTQAHCIDHNNKGYFNKNRQIQT